MVEVFNVGDYKMKVLQINSFFTVGGPPRIMNGIYDTLIENNHECLIAAAREKMYVPSHSIQIGSHNGIYINAIKNRVFDDEGLSASRETKELVNSIEEYDPDIIQLHNLHGYYINIEVLFNYLKRTRKPVVWTLHDCWAFTGHCAHFDLIKCEKWKTKCKLCPQKKDYPSSLFFNRAARNYMYKKRTFCGLDNMVIVTPSEWLKKLVQKSFLGDYEVKVINNGIDLEQFSFRKEKEYFDERLKKKKIILGVAQNWAEHKGLEDFISLSKLLDDSYKLVLIGLTKKQKELLPKTILGIERTRNVNELVDWYSRADVFINMTYQDNFPTVNIEALACGTPIITYNTGGSPEIIDSNCGWIIEKGDIKSALYIIKTMQSKEKYINAALLRSKKYDRKDKYRDYIDLYTQLLKNDRRPSFDK